MKKLRIYCDTSVFGGCFDPEFADASNRLFAEFRDGRSILVLSDIVLRELEDAPERVRRLLETIPDSWVEGYSAVSVYTPREVAGND
jgi:hypothetical protein